MARRRQDEDDKRSTYFPAAAINRGYSLSPRFMGGLQPSPAGSYYNPARYAGQGFSRAELNRIQRNLATQYTKDLEFNRIANPGFQTTQDTGYSSTAQFGSGRASPATVQQYALKFGTPTGNGLSTFQTPSGGSITYKPSGRILPGGVAPTVSPGSADLRQPLAQMATIQSGAYEKGFGTPVYPQQPQQMTPMQFAGKALSAIPTAPSRYGLPAIQSLYGAAQGAFNKASQLFKGNQQPSQPVYAAQPSGPRRYFDY